MTKDDLLVAAKGAFGKRAWAHVGYWNIQIETDPPREIVFSSAFVEANIDTEGMSGSELEEFLRSIPENKWVKLPNGSLTLYVP